MDEKALNELLECSVCLDRLDHTSKVLPCQHTFCRRCLDEIILTKSELRCPECRARVEVRVEDLPNNILLIRLLDGLKASGVINSTEVETKIREVAVTSSNVIKQIQPCAKAIYNYEAKESGDLAFKKGDVILLKKQLDDNWYHGEFNGQNGFFPVSYVKVLVPLPQTPQCQAMYDFDLKDEKEKDCLVFKKHDVLSVIRRIDDNWVEGKKGDKIGIFPLSFVELNDAAKKMIKVDKNLPLVVTLPGDPPISGQLPCPPHQKRHSYTSTSNYSLASSTNPHRHSCELSSSGGYISTLTTPSTTPTPAQQPVNQQSVNQQPENQQSVNQQSESSISRSSNLSQTTSQSSTSTNLTTPMYVSMYNYKSQKQDELELKKGEYYSVKEKCQDGWFKGQCVKTGKSGVFPGNYVQMIRQPSAFKPITSTNNRSGEPSNSMLPSVSSPMLPSTSSVSTTLATSGSKASPPPVPPPLLPRTNKSHTSVSVGKKAPGISGASLVAIQHSLSASSTVTPPNKVASSSGEAQPLPLTQFKEKEKKKEKSGKSLAKLLHVGGKGKKSKAVVVTTPDTVVVNHATPSNDMAASNHRSGVHTNPQGAKSDQKGAKGDQKKSSSDTTTSPKPVRPKVLPREKYCCIAPYPPQTEHELELQVGDIVYVHRKHEDGWFRGTLQRNGKTGLFPGSFVDSV